MKRNVIILKGVSGAGKSTFANLIAYPACVCCADDYYVDANGNYNWDANKIGEAHNACRKKFDDALKDNVITNIVIANTNVREADYKYYVDQAKKFNLNVFYVVLEKRHDSENVHGVPNESLQRQHDRLINNLKLM